MHGHGEKLSNLKSEQPSYSKRKIGSKLHTSLQINDGSKISHTKQHKPKSKFHLKTGDSTLLKEKVRKTSSKGNRTGFANGRCVNKRTLPRNTGTKFSRKQSTSKFQGENSLGSLRGNGENTNADYNTQKLKKRRKHNRQKDNVELDEASRLQRRARYLLIKMKLEQNLIDAYSGEGWKGQSREKIRPEKELQRAKKQILKCKLGIRDAIHQLDLLSSVGCIEDSVIAPDGSVYHEHIFCAKCKLREAFPDNDIILCDGTCNCAFHQKCLDPPLETENIPPGDQGWLCKFCECKMEILEAMNAHLGTHFSVDSNWQDIFKEEAAFPDGGSAPLKPEEEWPSDDSEDDDYDPARNENSSSSSRAGTESNASDDTSSFSSLSWSLEVLSGSGRLVKRHRDSKIDSVDIAFSGDSDDTTDHEIINGRRQRRIVDYKKLYDEMFGKDDLASEQLSEDEDWGPARKRRKEKESDAASTLMTLYESENRSAEVENAKVKSELPDCSHIKKHFFRIPPSAVEKLRHVFAENELPSRAVKEKLSRQLGLELEKVNKWFKNARYMALKSRKAEGVKPPHSPGPSIFKESISENNAIDPVATINSSATLALTLKNLKKIRQRRNRKSFTSPSIKKLHKGVSLGSPTNGNKVVMEFSDNVSLKKQLKRLKEKINREKKGVKLKSGGVQEAEREMERLCQMKNKLEQLKQMLLGLQNDKTNKSNEHSVIYVPVAELRERV
ncbi:pathogenesis-related homeodomain protein isoform X2 [Malania oleifera]|nr:pathogenesis-related homeodomain protein isoform X2 [Malania oleifera]